MGDYIGANADSPLYGESAKHNFATVTIDVHGTPLKKGDIVVILIKYLDDWCIVDPGNDEPMELVPFSCLQSWVKVDKVTAPAQRALPSSTAKINAEQKSVLRDLTR